MSFSQPPDNSTSLRSTQFLQSLQAYTPRSQQVQPPLSNNSTSLPPAAPLQSNFNDATSPHSYKPIPQYEPITRRSVTSTRSSGLTPGPASSLPAVQQLSNPSQPAYTPKQEPLAPYQQQFFPETTTITTTYYQLSSTNQPEEFNTTKVSTFTTPSATQISAFDPLKQAEAEPVKRTVVPQNMQTPQKSHHQSTQNLRQNYHLGQSTQQRTRTPMEEEVNQWVQPVFDEFILNNFGVQRNTTNNTSFRSLSGNSSKHHLINTSQHVEKHLLEVIEQQKTLIEQQQDHISQQHLHQSSMSSQVPAAQATSKQSRLGLNDTYDNHYAGNSNTSNIWQNPPHHTHHLSDAVAQTTPTHIGGYSYLQEVYGTQNGVVTPELNKYQTQQYPLQQSQQKQEQQQANYSYSPTPENNNVQNTKLISPAIDEILEVQQQLSVTAPVDYSLINNNNNIDYSTSNLNQFTSALPNHQTNSTLTNHDTINGYTYSSAIPSNSYNPYAYSQYLPPHQSVLATAVVYQTAPPVEVVSAPVLINLNKRSEEFEVLQDEDLTPFNNGAYAEGMHVNRFERVKRAEIENEHSLPVDNDVDLLESRAHHFVEDTPQRNYEYSASPEQKNLAGNAGVVVAAPVVQTVITVDDLHLNSSSQQEIPIVTENDEEDNYNHIIHGYDDNDGNQEEKEKRNANTNHRSRESELYDQVAAAGATVMSTPGRSQSQSDSSSIIMIHDIQQQVNDNIKKYDSKVSKNEGDCEQNSLEEQDEEETPRQTPQTNNNQLVGQTKNTAVTKKNQQAQASTSTRQKQSVTVASFPATSTRSSRLSHKESIPAIQMRSPKKEVAAKSNTSIVKQSQKIDPVKEQQQSQQQRTEIQRKISAASANQLSIFSPTKKPQLRDSIENIQTAKSIELSQSKNNASEYAAKTPTHPMKFEMTLSPVNSLSQSQQSRTYLESSKHQNTEGMTFNLYQQWQENRKDTDGSRSSIRKHQQQLDSSKITLNQSVSSAHNGKQNNQSASLISSRTAQQLKQDQKQQLLEVEQKLQKEQQELTRLVSSTSNLNPTKQLTGVSLKQDSQMQPAQQRPQKPLMNPIIARSQNQVMRRVDSETRLSAIDALSNVNTVGSLRQSGASPLNAPNKSIVNQQSHLSQTKQNNRSPKNRQESIPLSQQQAQQQQQQRIYNNNKMGSPNKQQKLSESNGVNANNTTKNTNTPAQIVGQRTESNGSVQVVRGVYGQNASPQPRSNNAKNNNSNDVANRTLNQNGSLTHISSSGVAVTTSPKTEEILYAEYMREKREEFLRQNEVDGFSDGQLTQEQQEYLNRDKFLEFIERNEVWLREKQRKIKEQQELQAQAEMRECTFKPSTNASMMSIYSDSQLNPQQLQYSRVSAAPIPSTKSSRLVEESTKLKQQALSASQQQFTSPRQKSQQSLQQQPKISQLSSVKSSPPRKNRATENNNNLSYNSQNMIGMNSFDRPMRNNTALTTLDDQNICKDIEDVMGILSNLI